MEISKKLLCTKVSIHALRVEGDTFISTLCYNIDSFYPRPPGGGRHVPKANKANGNRVSIHALRVEGDAGTGLFLSRAITFLSTPSGWRATLTILNGGHFVTVSIHALRVEGDVRRKVT